MLLGVAKDLGKIWIFSLKKTTTISDQFADTHSIQLAALNQLIQRSTHNIPAKQQLFFPKDRVPFSKKIPSYVTINHPPQIIQPQSLFFFSYAHAYFLPSSGFVHVCLWQWVNMMFKENRKCIVENPISLSLSHSHSLYLSLSLPSTPLSFLYLRYSRMLHS